MARIDRRRFFSAIRTSLFRSGMSQSQVDGTNRLLDAWEKYYATRPRRWLSYCLATSYHETNKKMQPVRENGGPTYLRTNYDVTGRNPDRARKNGNIHPGDGVRFAGRGDVQVTWRNNYRKLTQMLRLLSPDFAKLDLEQTPDRALEPTISALALFEGCIQGLYTGRRLSQFLGDDKADFIGARWVVNGQDDAELIAGYATAFDAALRLATGVDVPVPQPDPRRRQENDAEAPVEPPLADYPGEPDTGDGKAWWESSQIRATIVGYLVALFSAVNTPWGYAAVAGVVVVGGLAAAWVIRERMRLSYQKGV